MGNVIRFLNDISEWMRSLIEILVIAFFSFLPLGALVIRQNIGIGGEQFEVSSVLYSAISGGQLYLYVFGMYGTMMWLSFFDWRYPYHKMRLFLAFIVIVVGFYITSLANFDPTFSTFADDWVISASYITYAVCVLLYWLLLISSKKEPPPATATLEAGAKKLASDLYALDGEASR